MDFFAIEIAGFCLYLLTIRWVWGRRRGNINFALAFSVLLLGSADASAQATGSSVGRAHVTFFPGSDLGAAETYVQPSYDGVASSSVYHYWHDNLTDPKNTLPGFDPRSYPSPAGSAETVEVYLYDYGDYYFGAAQVYHRTIRQKSASTSNGVPGGVYLLPQILGRLTVNVPKDSSYVVVSIAASAAAAAPRALYPVPTASMHSNYSSFATVSGSGAIGSPQQVYCWSMPVMSDGSYASATLGASYSGQTFQSQYGGVVLDGIRVAQDIINNPTTQPTTQPTTRPDVKGIDDRVKEIIAKSAESEKRPGVMKDISSTLRKCESPEQMRTELIAGLILWNVSIEDSIATAGPVAQTGGLKNYITADDFITGVVTAINLMELHLGKLMGIIQMVGTALCLIATMLSVWFCIWWGFGARNPEQTAPPVFNARV